MTRWVKTRPWVPGAAIALAMFAVAAQAQAAAALGAVQTGMAQELPPAQIFTLLFLMLGPFKIIGPFTQLTKGADHRQAHRIAALSTVFASAALLVAAFLGGSILESYRIPVPVMALSGGLILFLVALKNLLQQFQMHADADQPAAPAPSMKVALMPLAFPTIVTPYGIAALVVLMAVSPDAQGAVGGRRHRHRDHAGQSGDHDAGAQDSAGDGHRAADPWRGARRGAGGAGPADHQQLADHDGGPMTAPAPDTATVLALERTRVAYERTMMAWVRTGTSLITFGFSVYKFFQLEKAVKVSAEMLIGPREFAMALIVIGLMALVVGTMEHAPRPEVAWRTVPATCRGSLSRWSRWSWSLLGPLR